MKIRNEKEVPITAAFIIDTMNDEINDYWIPDEKPFNKEIGNYFETKEDAEKAVKKLKAWKRLKDNGFKFEGIENRSHRIKFYQGRSYETEQQCIQAGIDLDLLFGGEE